MKSISQYINESVDSLNALFSFTNFVGQRTIIPNAYKLDDDQLLANIASPFIEYAIVQNFKAKDHGDWYSKLFTKVTWNRSSSLWDFSAELDPELFNASNVQDLPFGKKLNFEVKAFRGDPHDITLTKAQYNALDSDDVYFILVDYAVADGEYDIKNMYLTDAKTMKSVMGAKSVRSSAFKQIILKED